MDKFTNNNCKDEYEDVTLTDDLTLNSDVTQTDDLAQNNDAQNPAGKGKELFLMKILKTVRKKVNY